MSAPNLSEPIRTAILGESGITALLGTYLGEPAVLTRRPSPDENISYPFIVVSTDITVMDQDGLMDFRPVVTRDVTVFTRNDTAEHYRVANTIAFQLYELFHRQWRALEVDDWHVIDIQANGPIVTAEEPGSQIVGRLVTLEIKLAQSRMEQEIALPSHLQLTDGSQLLLTDSGVLILAGES
jgi:hypothetical protein